MEMMMKHKHNIYNLQIVNEFKIYKKNSVIRLVAGAFNNSVCHSNQQYEPNERQPIATVTTKRTHPTINAQKKVRYHAHTHGDDCRGFSIQFFFLFFFFVYICFTSAIFIGILFNFVVRINRV